MPRTTSSQRTYSFPFPFLPFSFYLPSHPADLSPPHSDPEARAKAKELSDKAKAEAHDLSAKAKSEARQISSDVKSEAHKLSGDLQNLGHSASGQAKGAYYDAKASGQDALARGENKSGATGYVEQAKQEGKSLLSSARASGERASGEAEGTLTELKEVSWKSMQISGFR